MIRPFQYRARVKRVIDGDTVDLEVDLGFYIIHQLTVRLAGVDAPETRGRDKAAGNAAREYLRTLAHRGVGDWPILCETQKDRPNWTATLFYYDPDKAALVEINDEMIRAGYAMKEL